MGARHAPAILTGRFVRVLARLRKPGGGSAMPGLIVNKIAPGFLASALASFPHGLVIVTGSSGKSTTTKMLVAVLEAHGLRTFTNPSTANITQGLTSALLERASLTGRVDADIAVLEMDEGHGALIAPRLTPRIVVLTNVMTDQIDRFHDSEKVLEYLATIARRATGVVVTNGDDAMLEELAASLDVDVRRFGVASAVLESQRRGLGYTRTTPTRIGAGAVVTGTVARTATIDLDGHELALALPARGVHYAVDAAAAISAAFAILGDRFDPEVAVSTFDALDPVFGRGEVTEVRGVPVEFVLVQNPASYQLNVEALDPGLDQILFAMGSDVRDPGYFWPVDVGRLGRVRVVSGSKAHELALHLAYHDVAIDRIEPDVPAALEAFFALPEPTSGIKTILFTAESMRRTRAHLGLKS